MGCEFLEKAENKEKEACLEEWKHSCTEVPTIESPLWLTEDKLLHSDVVIVPQYTCSNFTY